MEVKSTNIKQNDKTFISCWQNKRLNGLDDTEEKLLDVEGCRYHDDYRDDLGGTVSSFSDAENSSRIN